VMATEAKIQVRTTEFMVDLYIIYNHFIDIFLIFVEGSKGSWKAAVAAVGAALQGAGKLSDCELESPIG
jgi:hypothetical protein